VHLQNLSFSAFRQNRMAKNMTSINIITAIGINPLLFSATSGADEVNMRYVSFADPNANNEKITTHVLYLFCAWFI
jgi:hypothetical protein